MKKTMAMLLALLLVAVMLPVTAMAEGAMPEADADGVIRLNSDLAINTYEVKDSEEVIIDLGGYTLTIGYFDVYNGGSLTLRNGNVNGTVWAYGGNTATTKVTIESDVVMTAGYCVILEGGVNGQTNGTYPTDKGTTHGTYGKSEINIAGTCNGIGLWVMGNLGNSDARSKIKVTDNVINVTGKLNGDELGMAVQGVATVNVNGATITGDTAVYIKSGTVNITNSTLTGNGEAKLPVANGNGADATGDAIVMDSKTGYAGNMILNLGAGNTITSTNGYALQVANTDVATTNVVALNITGGNLTGKSDAVLLSPQFKDAVANENINASASITGGTFSGNTNELKPYIPSNMEITASGNVVNKPITIIVPSEGGSTTTTPSTDNTKNPSTDNTKNPSTGANDFVGVAAALAVVSVLGAAVAVRKK